MAKKTSYLTELIDRHERWKAEGGERLDDEEQHKGPDMYVSPLAHPECVHRRFAIAPWVATQTTSGILGQSVTSTDRELSVVHKIPLQYLALL